MDSFGAGQPTPGSGSASALQGVLACSMILACARLTADRANTPQRRLESAYVAEIVQARHEPILRALVQRDSTAFARAINARTDMHKQTKPGRRKAAAAKARRLLKTATNIPLTIVQHCLAVARLGIQMFDIGYKAARGDPGTGVSAALAGAFGALFVTFQNLTKFRETQWSLDIRRKCEGYWSDALKVLEELLSRVSRLRDEVDAAWSGQMRLALLPVEGSAVVALTSKTNRRARKPKSKARRAA